MAGMSCGEVSLLAWEILSRGAVDFVTIGDEGVAPAMRLMASGDAGGGPIEAGECALAGVVALIAAARRSEEHTAELQSLNRISYAVICLKKITIRIVHNT